MVKDNSPQKHHFVPKSYLDNFACFNEKGKIWTFDKKSPGSKRETRTEETASQKNYNSFVKKDGSRSDGFEELIEKTETIGTPVLKKIIERENFHELSEQEMADFSSYIAMMVVRTPSFRNRAAQTYLMEQLAWCKKYVEDLGGFERYCDKHNLTLQERKKLKEFFLNPKNLKIAYCSEWFLRFIEFHDHILPVIYNMHWKLFVSPKDCYFITNDNPVLIYVNPNQKFETPHLSNFCFPLSPKFALIGDWRPTPPRRLCHEKEVLQINHEVAKNAHQYVYSHAENIFIHQLVEEYKNYQPMHEPFRAKYSGKIELTLKRGFQ